MWPQYAITLPFYSKVVIKKWFRRFICSNTVRFYHRNRDCLATGWVAHALMRTGGNFQGLCPRGWPGLFLLLLLDDKSTPTVLEPKHTTCRGTKHLKLLEATWEDPEGTTQVNTGEADWCSVHGWPLWPPVEVTQVPSRCLPPPGHPGYLRGCFRDQPSAPQQNLIRAHHSQHILTRIGSEGKEKTPLSY